MLVRPTNDRMKQIQEEVSLEVGFELEFGRGGRFDLRTYGNGEVSYYHQSWIAIQPGSWLCRTDVPSQEWPPQEERD